MLHCLRTGTWAPKLETLRNPTASIVVVLVASIPQHVSAELLCRLRTNWRGSGSLCSQLCGEDNSHVCPVVCELLAATQAHDVGSLHSVRI